MTGREWKAVGPEGCEGIRVPDAEGKGYEAGAAAG